jgi:hypothetical protein
MIIACLALNAHPVVARGLDPRAYPLRRPNSVWAPRRVDPRNDDGDVAA